MASETKTSIMTVKVENGKNGEPMEVLDEKPRHVSGESDSEEEYHGQQHRLKYLLILLGFRAIWKHE